MKFGVAAASDKTRGILARQQTLDGIKSRGRRQRYGIHTLRRVGDQAGHVATVPIDAGDVFNRVNGQTVDTECTPAACMHTATLAGVHYTIQGWVRLCGVAPMHEQ